MDEKFCLSCQQIKSLKDFHKDGQMPDGRRKTCKVCRNAFESRRYRERPLEPPKPQTTSERFWAKVDKQQDCWIWAGSKMKDGYGHLGVERKMVLAHRFSYELSCGPVPDGMHLHHVCENQSCVRPDHLRVVSPIEHKELTPRSIAYQASQKTHCPQGHPYNEENTYIDKRGSRNCRVCHRLSYHRRKKAGL